MKRVSQALKRAIAEAYDIKAIPKITVEWEHNRFSPFALDTSVNPPVRRPLTVTPAQAQDLEWLDIYDLDSIAEPNRPRTGIAKARLASNDLIPSSGRYRSTPNETRYYLHGPDDPYTYWSSTQKTGSANSPSGYLFAEPIVLTLMYEAPVVSNKLVIGFETSYAKPTDYSIEVFDGLDWNEIQGSPVIDKDGIISLWRDSDGNWLQSPQYFKTDDNPRTLNGLRLTVRAMNRSNDHLDVLQMGLRLEADLSEYLEDYNKQFEISDTSFIAPLGAASSNVATVNLSNIDGIFNNDNENSPFFGLIGKKARVVVELSYDTTRFGGVADDRVRELTMWTDSWTGKQELTSKLSLKDSSVFLQEIDVPQVFWGDGPEETDKAVVQGYLTVGAIIWQLMDLVGMSNYAYSVDAIDLGQIVPYFWPDEETTVWDQISDLAEGTQTAVYFDEYDIMQIKTRRAIFGEREVIDWNLDAIKNGAKLPDIIELEVEDELVANDVTINYSPAKYSAYNKGFPKLETVWEPEEDTVMLRATPLMRDLLANQMEMWIRWNQVAFWPYESLVNIRGEHIKYKGKEYKIFMPGSPDRSELRWCNSLEDKQKADAESDPNRVYLNDWTGKIRIEQRGVGGTTAANHYVRPHAYNTKFTHGFNRVFHPMHNGAGQSHVAGVLTLSNTHDLGPHGYLLHEHETSVSSINSIYGMRFRFPSNQVQGNKWATGGIRFAGDWGDTGWYLEVSPTATVHDIERRTWRHELHLIGMRANKQAFPVRGGWDHTDAKGFTANILYDQWYDLDVRHVVYGNGDGSITAYLNGVWAGQWFFNAGFKHDLNDQGRWGPFTRWNCRMDLEYVYGINLNWGGPFQLGEPDQTSVLDLQRGGFTSGFIEREFRYGTHTTINRGPRHEGSHLFVQKKSYGEWALDEFGPVVHEIREIEVKFEEDNIPCSHSWLYFSNTAQVTCTDYHATPFGAKFTLVNSSRTNAILKGEDALTFGPDNEIDQSMFIYGRVLLQEDDLTKNEKDEDSIRKNGAVTVEFENRFIQTEEAATELAAWVTQFWGEGVDQVEVEIFGNPLLQLGDLVTVNYPLKDMRPSTHKYFIVGVDNSFNRGLETKLVLRRAKI